MHDLKFALRQLRKNPGFTAVAVLTLAISIGATTAITSVVRTALFEPLPVAHADRFLTLRAKDKLKAWSAWGLNPLAAREAQAATNVFCRVALWEMTGPFTLEGENLPQRLGGHLVTSEFFKMFPVAPMLGRLPSIDEAQMGAAPVIVLSYTAWQRVFGGDPSVVGRAVRFTQATVTVIGVMPPHFTFPRAHWSYWQPWAGPSVKAGDALNGHDSLPNTGVIAELREGATAMQAQALLDVIQARQAKQDEVVASSFFEAQALRESFGNPELRRTLWALTAATALVLLIASANLANLQLARTETRQQELAVRSALGSGRGRVIRQLFSESLLLAVLGGAAGLLVTLFGLELLTKLLPGELPRLKAIELDGGVIAVAALVTMGTSILFGVVPAWRGGQFNVAATLKLGGTTVTSGLRRAWFTRALIIGQVALVLVLLSGAGLMVRSVNKLLAVDVGFDPRDILVLNPDSLSLVNRLVKSAGGKEAGEEAVTGVFKDLQRRLASLPGVVAVGIRGYDGSRQAAVIPGGTTTEVDVHCVGIEEADPLRAIRARLKEGRWLARGDGQKGGERVLLNESAARRLWPGTSAVGKRLWIKRGVPEESVEIAGVIGDLREYAYNEQPKPTIYRARNRASPYHLVIRTPVPYSELRLAIERELKAVGTDFAQPWLQFVKDRLYEETAGHRTFMRYLLFFAGVGLLLAAIGLFGVVSYSISRRTREIGIRVALGAQRADIVELILRQGLVLVLIGMTIGLTGSLAATRALKSFLFGVPAHDPVTLAGVLFLLAAVALMACWLPARRAARVDPMVALRHE